MQHQMDAVALALGPRLAQRPGGQQPAVAHAAIIKHGNFNVACQGVVLQTVVAEHHIGGRIGRQQSAQSVGTAGGDKHRRARGPTDQRRLIARGLNWRI